jgi:phospholipase C
MRSLIEISENEGTMSNDESPLHDIDHIVVLMLENRSFDNLLGRLYTGVTAKEKGFDPMPLEASNEIPSDKYSPYTVWTNDNSMLDEATMTIPTPDPGELFSQMNQQIFGEEFGKQDTYVPEPPSSPPPNPPNMSGFAANYKAAGGDPHDIMHYFSPTQVPVTHFLATQYAVSDTYYASAPLQTWPNRMFAHCATSGGMLNNTQFLPVLFEEEFFGIKSIYDQIDALDCSQTRIPPTTPRWKVYYQDFPVSALVKHVRDNWKIGDMDSKVAHFSPLDLPWTTTGTSFFDDLKNDTLPAYSFIEPRYGLLQNIHEKNIIPPNDNHPPFNVALGELLLFEIWAALIAYKNWDRTLFIVTYDEHGGCYDHVPPTYTAPSPNGRCDDYPFIRYGVRVPNLFISPWILPGGVLKPKPDASGDIQYPFDHTSIIKTVRDCFFLGDARNQHLNPRDAAAPSFGHVLNAPVSALNHVSVDACPAPEVDMDAARAAFEKSGPADLVSDIEAMMDKLGIAVPS